MSGDALPERIAELGRRLGIDAVPRAAFVGVLAVALLILGVAVARRQASLSDGLEIVREASSAPLPKAAAGVSSLEPTTVVVHVVGAVRHPGIVVLPSGSRGQDAVDAAGGLLPNAAQAALNLARVCADGEQILVPTLDEIGAGGIEARQPVQSGASPLAPSRVDLNTASAELLDSLPGIGPSTAAKIIADREANGPFAAPEDLMRVPGIGPKKFDSLKDLVTVS